MSSKAQKLVKGSILRVIEFFASAIVGLILMPFIIHSLGDKMYGLWVFVGSFLGYYGLMDFGLNSAIQRFISRAIGTEDHHDISKTVNTALVIFSAIGLIALIITGAIAFILPLYVKNITEVVLFRQVLLILGLNFALGFPLRVFSGILTANLRYDVSTSIELVKLVLRTILVIIFLKNGYGIMALAVITFLLDIGGYTVKAVFVKRLYRYIVYSLSLFDRARVKNLFGYSVYTFIAQIADQLRFNVDNLVIAIFISLNMVTLYSIASRLVKYFMELLGGIFGITIPLFSQYEGMGNYQAIRDNYSLLIKLSTSLSIGIGGMLIIFGKVFILTWVGDKYLQAYQILLILLIPTIFDMIQFPGWGIIYGLSKHKYYALANGIEGLINLILSIILVKKYGIYGVALGTAIPMAIMKIIIQPYYVCKLIKLEYQRFIISIVMPIFIKSLAVMFIVWFVIKEYLKTNYADILLFSILVIIIYTYLIFRYGFNELEKIKIATGFLNKSKLGMTDK